MPVERGLDGKFILQTGIYIDSKGYWAYCAGPNRGKRVYRIKMERKLGRKLRKDEHVHHRNGNKLDISDDNLELMDQRKHNAVSAKQYWFLKTHVWPKERSEWDAYFEGGRG